MKLELVARQAPVLTPKFLSAIEILQMNSQQLQEYAAAAIEENPMLEMDGVKAEEPPVVFGEFSTPWSGTRKSRNLDEEVEINRVPDMSAEYEESLAESLRAQLLSLDLRPKVLAAALFLAESLNENGWLDESLDELSESCGCPVELLHEALRVLQNLEPAGVGASNLGECLSLQLQRNYPEETLAVEIAEKHLEALSRLRYNSIAAKTGASAEEVRDACALIRSLEPRPGRAFAKTRGAEYMLPDVLVLQNEEKFEVRVNGQSLPPLGVSAYYSALYEKSGDPELKAYLAEKLREARWLISTVERRHRTLCECVASLVRIQERFFREGKAELVPMSLLDIAVELGVHESTVSRALKGKYLQCQWGVYPMSFFFSRAFATMDGTNSASPERVKAMLRDMIESEDKLRPLSDQKLSEALAAAGYEVSRRTVAKYREKLGIPSAAGRKEL